MRITKSNRQFSLELRRLLRLHEENLEKKNAEIFEIQSQLIQAQKMEAIGQLTSGVAHDFNNILSGILAYAGILKQMRAEDSEVVERLEIIEKSALHAAELTKKLLGFSRKGKFQTVEINIDTAIEETISIARSSIDKNILISVDFKGPLWLIEGDPSQLMQVFLNLAVNARDAMPKGGNLLFEVTNQRISVTLKTTIGEVKPGNYVSIRVVDTGIGIEASDLKRIFEPFYTNNKNRNGSGLGLAMVAGIIEAHGGAIQVNSVLGTGTCFEIYLPASTPSRRN